MKARDFLNHFNEDDFDAKDMRLMRMRTDNHRSPDYLYPRTMKAISMTDWQAREDLVQALHGFITNPDKNPHTVFTNIFRLSPSQANNIQNIFDDERRILAREPEL